MINKKTMFEDIESIDPKLYGDFGPDTLHQMAFMESSYGQHPSTGDVTKTFSGPFQMGVEQYTQHGDVKGNRMDVKSSGGATLKMGAANISNTGTWKEYGMDKRLGELGISKELSAYMTHQQGRTGFINLLTGITGGDRPAEHVEGAMGPHNLSTDRSRYGGTKSAGGTFKNEEGTRKRLLSNISREKVSPGSDEYIDFAGMDTKELAQNWVRQTKSKWSKAGEDVEGLHSEFGTAAEKGKSLPSALAHIAEKKRSLRLEKPERPSLSDDDVFDSIADEPDIMPDEALTPKRMSEEEKKTKYDKQMSRFHKKRGIGNPEELKLRRAPSTLGKERIGVKEGVPNTKGNELDNIMHKLMGSEKKLW